MTDDTVLALSAREQVDAIARGTLTSESLMEATLARIAEVNETVNAVVSLKKPETLLDEARAFDKDRFDGPLAGLPTAIKDLAQAKGFINTQGSPIFADDLSDADDPHVAFMRDAGAMFIGKTNVPEFGLGSHTYNPVFGPTRNPYAPALSAGGSSGGAAAALATGMISVADGSDMMGSLRNPAGWCNVYGMRPTQGVVPGAEGGDLYLHTLATRGPMARDPGDLSLLLDVMSAASDIQDLISRAEGCRIAWLGDWGGALPTEPGILDLCESALAVLDDLGALVSSQRPPVSRDVLWDAWIDLRAWSIAADAHSLYHAAQTRAQLKPEIIWEIERGLSLSALDVHDASLKRSDWYRAAMTLFDSFDVLALPSAQVWPFSVDVHWPRKIGACGMDTYHRWMEVTVPASLIGLPAICVPAGFGQGGLPMGLQLMARPGADRVLLELAEAYHRATHWPQSFPPDLSQLSRPASP